METIYKKIMDDIENKEKAFNDIQNNALKYDQENSHTEKNNDEKSRMSGNNFSEVEMKMVRDCAKKVSELEKHFKILVNNINIDSIKNDIGKLNESVSTKASSSEVFDMKDSICNYL